MTICKEPGCSRYVLCELMVTELDKHCKVRRPERIFAGLLLYRRQKGGRAHLPARLVGRAAGAGSMTTPVCAVCHEEIHFNQGRAAFLASGAVSPVLIHYSLDASCWTSVESVAVTFGELLRELTPEQMIALGYEGEAA